MKVSDYIASFLEKKGITHVFELPGGMITHLIDSLSQKANIEIVTIHHEQAAAFAADAYGRATGLPGIAMATSGPGATNLLTGIGSCYFDSVPAVFITGQVNTYELKGDKNIRQLGFQETDIVAMAKPITKAVYQISDYNNIPSVFENAFQIAVEGRPGPVLIDIPMNIQRADLDIDKYYSDRKEENTYKVVDENILSTLINDIQNAKRPIILAGRGIQSSFSADLLVSLSEKLKIPIVTSLLALDVVPFNHPLRVGFIGSYGNRWANIALGESDFILVLGSRLDIRQTGADTKFFESKIIYHVDCESSEINNRIKNCTPVAADVKFFFKSFFAKVQSIEFELKQKWFDRINQLKIDWPDIKELSVEEGNINPNEFIHRLSQASCQAKAFIADVGAHQMWVAQSLELLKGQVFFTSAGMGAMGFALPASIGAALAFNKSAVVAIIGDGCMQINIQELQTIVRNQLPVKIIILNNQNLGMIRQFQDSYFQSRYHSTYWGYSAPDFEKVAEAYGIDSKTIRTPSEVDSAFHWLWNDDNALKPLLLQVMINPKTNTYPKIAFGKPITEMEPFSKPIEMEGT